MADLPSPAEAGYAKARVAVPQILFREILEPDPAAAFFDNTCEAGMM
jgi:hypothetical protein